jgi:hypothetical protein
VAKTCFYCLHRTAVLGILNRLFLHLFLMICGRSWFGPKLKEFCGFWVLIWFWGPGDWAVLFFEGSTSWIFWGQNQGNLWGLKGSVFDLADRAHNCQTTRLIIANGSDDECLNISNDQGLLRPKIYLCVNAPRELTTNVLGLLHYVTSIESISLKTLHHQLDLSVK